MSSHWIKWIWEVRGSLALGPRQSGEEAFDRLDPMFRETGTSYERSSDRLVFRKKGQHAQDKMSVFDGGVLEIAHEPAGRVLRYQLTSRALLFCFLAPLLFLSFAQLTVALGKMEQSSASEDSRKQDEKEDPAEKYAKIPMNPIDKFLGAPAPEQPKKDAKDKKEDEDKKPSPTPAYVFAGLFAVLYVAGRILEDRLVRARFRKRLFG